MRAHGLPVRSQRRSQQQWSADSGGTRAVLDRCVGRLLLEVRDLPVAPPHLHGVARILRPTDDRRSQCSGDL